MTNPAAYDFRAVTPDDLALLRDWRSAPHVREWWGPGEPWTAADLADPRVDRRIVCLRGRPFAFMQDYTVHGWEDHHFAGLPPGARGIDQFIGAARMLGLGHGTAFIRSRMRALFAAGAPVIATDPDPRNARAIAVYSRLGFAPAGPARDSAWGPILPMVARP